MCTITLTLNDIQADNSECGAYLQVPSKRTRSLEWKVAVIAVYVPCSIEVTITTTTPRSKEQ